MRAKPSRRQFVLVLLAALLLGGGYVALWVTRPVRITERGSKEIKAGMATDEVLAIMRLPPGDYSYRPQRRLFEQTSIVHIYGVGVQYLYWREWVDEDGTLAVAFNSK